MKSQFFRGRFRSDHATCRRPRQSNHLEWHTHPCGRSEAWPCQTKKYGWGVKILGLAFLAGQPWENTNARGWRGVLGAFVQTQHILIIKHSVVTLQLLLNAYSSTTPQLLLNYSPVVTPQFPQLLLNC